MEVDEAKNKRDTMDVSITAAKEEIVLSKTRQKIFEFVKT
jgi:hypothetical protein